MKTKHKHKKNLKTKAKTKRKIKKLAPLHGTIEYSVVVTNQPLENSNSYPISDTVGGTYNYTDPVDVHEHTVVQQETSFGLFKPSLAYYGDAMQITLTGNIAAHLNRLKPGLPVREQLLSAGLPLMAAGVNTTKSDYDENRTWTDTVVPSWPEPDFYVTVRSWTLTGLNHVESSGVITFP